MSLPHKPDSTRQPADLPAVLGEKRHSPVTRKCQLVQLTHLLKPPSLFSMDFRHASSITNSTGGASGTLFEVVLDDSGRASHCRTRTTFQFQHCHPAGTAPVAASTTGVTKSEEVNVIRPIQWGFPLCSAIRTSLPNSTSNRSCGTPRGFGMGVVEVPLICRGLKRDKSDICSILDQQRSKADVAISQYVIGLIPFSESIADGSHESVIVIETEPPRR